MFVTDTFKIKVGGVPVSIDGAVTVNLDANGDGMFLAGSGNASQLFHGDLQDLEAVYRDIDFGVNGIIDLDVPNVAKIDLQLGDVTTVFDGPGLGLWVSGTAGLKDPLANSAFKDFVITNHDMFQATVNTPGSGAFFVSFSTQENLVGARIGFIVTLQNSGFSTEITGSAGWSVNGVSAQATLTGDLSITVDPATGKLRYFGSVHASGKVTTGFGSGSFDVGAEVAGNKLIFDLPLLGRQTIDLS